MSNLHSRMMPGVAVDLARAWEELDVDRRLRSVPPRAAIRGVFFDLIDDALRRHGLSESPRWLGVRATPRRSYKLYPVGEWLTAFATAATLINADAREGMRDIFSDGSRYFASTWFGRAFRSFLRPDPLPALSWIERSREHLVNYGRWRVERRGPCHAVLHMFDEYIWIESAHRGGCEGLLVACGVQGSVTAEIDGPFDGRLHVRWTPQN